MTHVTVKDIEIYLPLPIFPVIEDVGWWQGEDGSAMQQPYRNGFPRRHCLADYQALAHLADKLGTRICLAMALGEWDRNNILAAVPGATWNGEYWDNRMNQGPWLDETAEYLRSRHKSFELALHALCHEFWHERTMDRSEFHDSNGIMRSRTIIRSHLEAFGTILEQNGFSQFPRIFIPPALNHSFGNGKNSIQAILRQFGIDYVITRFCRARQFTPPHHQKMTWECGIGLFERGLSPVAWNASASPAHWDFSGSILPLHWGNLLHPDPEQNIDIVNAWAELLLAGSSGPERVLAADFSSCWSQAAAFYFGKLLLDGDSVIVDLQDLPPELPNTNGSFCLKIRNCLGDPSVKGAKIVFGRPNSGNIRILQLEPYKGVKAIQLFFS